jgi:hypothetical protein
MLLRRALRTHSAILGCTPIQVLRDIEDLPAGKHLVELFELTIGISPLAVPDLCLDPQDQHD